MTGRVSHRVFAVESATWQTQPALSIKLISVLDYHGQPTALLLVLLSLKLCVVPPYVIVALPVFVQVLIDADTFRSGLLGSAPVCRNSTLHDVIVTVPRPLTLVPLRQSKKSYSPVVDTNLSIFPFTLSTIT
jgi:hypothetical protein